MRVLVCGGREYRARKRLFRVLDDLASELGGIALLVHGNARGADRLAAAWAEARNVAVRAYDADWRRLGPAAGPIRNQRMLENSLPEIVVAFPGGAGTANMVEISEAAGVEVRRVPSETVTIQITAPKGLTSGLVARDGVAVEAAPTLKYMLGWDGEQVAKYCRSRGWEWVAVPQSA